MAKMDSAHPGFEDVAAHIAQHEGVPLENARAILAHAAHHASEAAVKKNPRLKRVSGMAKKS